MTPFSPGQAPPQNHATISEKAFQYFTEMATLSPVHTQAAALWRPRRQWNRSLERTSCCQLKHAARLQARYRGLEPLYDDGYQTVKNLDYFYESFGELVEHDSGPPRWFCPVDAGSPIEDAPLMLYLPGKHASKMFA
jgi:hypothetical protein